MNEKDIEAFMDKLADEQIGSYAVDEFSKSEREFADLLERLGDGSDEELSENRKFDLFQHRLTAYQVGLEDAQAEASSQSSPKTIPFPNRTSVITLVAAACVVIGALTFLNWNNTSTADAELRNEVAGLKNMLVLSLLSHESPVQRMDGAAQAALLASPSNEITNQLFQILNNDPNVNVRLAAISSLGKLDPALSSRLLDSLTDQPSVLVQLEIVHTVLNLGQDNDRDRLKQLIAESELAPDRATRFQRVMNTGI